jgi:hypothetical protein
MYYVKKIPVGNISNILSYYHMFMFSFLLGPKLSQWFFFAQTISKILGKAGALHIIWRGADQKVSCWDNSTINGCFQGTSTIDGGLNRTIHRKWSFEEDNL